MPKSTTSLSLLLVICALVACGRCDRIESGADRSHEAPTPASIDRGPLAQLPSGFVPVEMPGPPPPNHDPFPRVILSSVGVWIDGQSVAGDETSQLRALSDAVTTGWRRNPGHEHGTMHVWVDARSTVGELRPHLLRMAEQASVHVLGVAPRAPSADPSSDRALVTQPLEALAVASAALDATVASLIGLTGLEDPGGLSADVPNEGRLSTVEEVWAGVRIGAFTYAITGVGEEGHAPDGDSAHLGYTVREGEVSPMRFHARTLEEHGPLPKLVTVLARNGERCVGEVTRGLRLEGKCSEEWIESYPAIEIDCRLSPDVVLVVSGAHPSATWGSLDFGSRGISFRDVPVPDDIESVGVFRRGQLIAEVAGPAYTSTVEALAVDGETFALLPTGHHGHGIAVVAIERRPAGVAQIAHPATACGAF